MPDLANLDQAMRDLWDRVRRENPDISERSLIHRAMKEAYAMAERKNELARQFIKGDAKAKELFDKIQDAASGTNYAPCLRDDLGDAEEWVVPLIAEFLARQFIKGGE